MAINENCFSVDDFQNPLIYKDAEAVATLLTRLLLLEPGTIQSHPDAGVGIISRFRYSTEGHANELQSEYQRQIEKYMPQFRGALVDVQEDKDRYIISVRIDGTLYGIYYDVNTSDISTRYVRLSNL